MREKTGFRTCLVAMVVTLLVGSNLQATIWYVKQNATGSGTSWTDASGNLKNILDGAQPLDEVWVAEGTYTPGAQVSDKFELPVLVEVYGGFSGTPGTEEVFTERDPVARPTVLSGLLQTQPEVRSQTIVYATNVTSETILDGFTITGATSYAIHNVSEASPIYRNLIIENNTGSSGAGMYSYYLCSPELVNCTFQDNTASRSGGAVYNDTQCTPLFDNCLFDNNTCQYGSGGAINEGS